MPTSYRTVDVNGASIFYREAGDAALPTILLLHGFPSSSHMYRDLIPLLAERYHAVAPDYPGSGYSEAAAGMPATFDALADVVAGFVEAIGLRRYALYLQDFGGPVGMRLALRHPERVSGLVVQNANAYEEGLSDILRHNIAQLKPGARTDADAQPLLDMILNPDGVRFMYETGARDPQHLNPDAWAHDLARLDVGDNRRIQEGLLRDYHSNVALYPAWQAWLRAAQVPALVAWGRGDPLFVEAGARAWQRDLPRAELHLLDTGHFALEEDAPRIAQLVLHFLDRLEREVA
ncbi:alpha/beta hydrolase [Massilia arenosa]|uniref:Alpha/beta hydrolase n=1 Tax=Zemynaea arenosa TaxID=2561931 RepID=A0A4Y9SJR9_9BURK|nr:alpha/beta hydrolase [Massilia arenosa]TFW21250.1 alpha/beta hydrolase [Massilia arenosa]